MTTSNCMTGSRGRVADGCMPTLRSTTMMVALPSLLAMPLCVVAQDTPQSDDNALHEVVVTAVHDHSPVQVVTDPKQPRQPMPASDAADYLKSIPGFSAIRSGGSNSDPVFRGQFGSRLPLLTNGTQLLGACPSRMDAPSAYISPETFDVLTVVKGPQTVIWGPGASSGVVRFDRERPDFDTFGTQFTGSVLGASAGRNDQNMDLTIGDAHYYARITANRSHGDDYQDGNGQRVPSAWNKWNADVALGWTPNANTLLELSAGAGDGHARYGGRGMDGTKFRRDSWGLRFERLNLTSWWTKLEAQIYANQADHVMDNFSLRPFSASSGMAMPMASNVRRTTTGARVAATLQLHDEWQWIVGLDTQRSPHEQRKANPNHQAYAAKPWQRDAKFSNLGVFAEWRWQAQEHTRWLGGLRFDHAQAWRYPVMDSMGMSAGAMHHAGMSAGMSQMPGMVNAMAMAHNHRRRSAMPSGFVRWEHTLTSGASVYAGLGHVQRFPDYWELISPANSAEDSGNAFAALRPEKTTQVDVGASWKGTGWSLWSAAYVGMVKDYIVFDYQNARDVRNVDARTAGVELGGSYRLNPLWTAQGTLSYNWARNTTDAHPLAQTPPLEARLGLDYAQGPWSAGALWRLVAAQHRYATGQGNVVGRDMGPSAGFGVFSLHAGYRVNDHFKLVAGVDNLLDKNYAEHLNLAGNAGFGYPGGQRINEPGRTLWLRADVKF